MCLGFSAVTTAGRGRNPAIPRLSRRRPTPRVPRDREPRPRSLSSSHGAALRSGRDQFTWRPSGAARRACRLAPQADRLGKRRASLGVVWRYHRVVGGEAPLGPILLGRQAAGRVKVALERLQLLVVLQTDDVISEDRSFDRYCRLPLFWFWCRRFRIYQRGVDRLYQSRQISDRHRVMPEWAETICAARLRSWSLMVSIYSGLSRRLPPRPIAFASVERFSA